MLQQYLQFLLQNTGGSQMFYLAKGETLTRLGSVIYILSYLQHISNIIWLIWQKQIFCQKAGFQYNIDIYDVVERE